MMVATDGVARAAMVFEEESPMERGVSEEMVKGEI